METFIGYAVIALMGVCLGLVGAGGSMLAVPVLIYVFRIDPTLATVYGSIIVGITAASGAARSVALHSIDRPAVFWFGIPCVAGAYFARYCLISLIPQVMISIPGFELTRDAFVVLLFSATMLFAGFSMFSRRKLETAREMDQGWRLPVGFSVGMVTGIVGAGGGFLILPALILIAGLDMSRAIGTSLTIIAIKSLASLVGDLSAGLTIDFILVGSLAATAIPGVILGRWMSQFVGSSAIRTGFGLVIGTTGAVMGIHQLIVLMMRY